MLSVPGSILIEMTFDTFQQVQGILAKRPFEEVENIIMAFRQQVVAQVERHRQQAQQPEAPQQAARPHLVEQEVSGA